MVFSQLLWETNPDNTSKFVISKNESNLPGSNTNLVSQSIKLKSNYVFSMYPKNLLDLTISLHGLKQGSMIYQIYNWLITIQDYKSLYYLKRNRVFC